MIVLKVIESMISYNNIVTWFVLLSFTFGILFKLIRGTSS